MENDKALGLLGKRLEYLDNLEWFPRQEMLITSILAGNMFDWGAREVADLMENTDFGFHEARSKIQGISFMWKLFSSNYICGNFTWKIHVVLTARPWLVDGLDKWIDRLKGPPHKCAAIFVDNSGIDIVLGILPFARELLQRGTKVIETSTHIMLMVFL